MAGLLKLKSLVTIALTATACYLWLTAQVVPTELLTATGLAWGSLFQKPNSADGKGGLINRV